MVVEPGYPRILLLASIIFLTWAGKYPLASDLLLRGLGINSWQIVSGKIDMEILKWMVLDALGCMNNADFEQKDNKIKINLWLTAPKGATPVN